MNWQSHRETQAAAAALAVGRRVGQRRGPGPRSPGAGTAANAVTSSCLTLGGEPLRGSSKIVITNNKSEILFFM